MTSESLWEELIHLVSGADRAFSLRLLAKQLDSDPDTIQKVIATHQNEARQAGFHLTQRLGRVQLVVDNRELFSQRRLSAAAEDENQQRIDEILTILVEKNDFIKIEDLANQLFLSRATVDRLMRQLKEAAREYRLEIVSRPKYGIKLDGRETDKRLCYAHHHKEQKDTPADEELIKVVQKILWQVMQEYDLRLNDINFYNLSYHCVIALRRISEGNQITTPPTISEAQVSSPEWQAASDIVDRFEREFGLHIEPSETQYIMMHLLGKRIVENDQNISPEVWTFVEEVVEKIWQVKQIDFRDDADLKTMLALHFQPMLTRLRLNIPQANPLLGQIKLDMGPGYELALCCAEVLKQRYQITMNENEAGYLALHFSLALEKQQKKIPSRRIAIVCASGRGISRLIQYKMMQRYHYREENLVPLSLFEVNDLDPGEYSCILSTVPIPGPTPVPVVLIDLTMNEASLQRVKPYVSGPPAGEPSGQIRPTLIVLQQEMNSREEILSYLCRELSQAAGLWVDPYEQVMKREQLSATEIGNEIAVPHPFDYEVEKPCLALMTLKRPVVWKKNKVRIVILMLLPKQESFESRKVTEFIAELGNDPDWVRELLLCRKQEEVLSCLNQNRH